MTKLQLICCLVLTLVIVQSTSVLAQSHAGRKIAGMPSNLRPSSEDPHCGADCLFILLCYFGKGPSTYRELVSKLGPPPSEGYSLLELGEVAIAYGAYAQCVTLDFKSMAELPQDVKSLLLLKDPSNYVIVRATRSNTFDTSIELEDADGAIIALGPTELSQRWDGQALLLSPNPIAISGFKINPLLLTAIGVTCVGIGVLIWNRRRA